MALVIGRNGNIAKTLRHASINARLDPALNGGVCAANRINAIETGKMVPSTVLALKLAAALNVSVETLFSLSPDQA